MSLTDPAIFNCRLYESKNIVSQARLVKFLFKFNQNVFRSMGSIAQFQDFRGGDIQLNDAFGV